MTSFENVSCPLALHWTGFGLLSSHPAGNPWGSLANYTDRALADFREGSMTLNYFRGIFLPAGAATREIPFRTNCFLISLLCNVREECIILPFSSYLLISFYNFSITMFVYFSDFDIKDEVLSLKCCRC